MVSNVKEMLEKHGPFERINVKQVASELCNRDKRLEDVIFLSSLKGKFKMAWDMTIRPNTLSFEESFKKNYYKGILAQDWWNNEFCERIKSPEKLIRIEDIIEDSSILKTNGNLDYSSFGTCDMNLFKDVNFEREIKIDEDLTEFEKRTIIFNRITKELLQASFFTWLEPLNDSSFQKFKTRQFDDMTETEQAHLISTMIDYRLNQGLKILGSSKLVPKFIRERVPYVNQKPLYYLFPNNIREEFYILSNPKNESLNLDEIREILENSYLGRKYQANNHGITTLVTNTLNDVYFEIYGGKWLNKEEKVIEYIPEVFEKMYTAQNDIDYFDLETRSNKYSGCPILRHKSNLHGRAMFNDFFWYQADAYLEFRKAYFESK